VAVAARGIHHIGSAAVPGLAAKPILDILAGVSDLRSAVAVPVLQGLSYGHADHRPDALWFCKPRQPASGSAPASSISPDLEAAGGVLR
jgi:GrpB-like predicted nucleotidyltransferase (UPF0157 family)